MAFSIFTSSVAKRQNLKGNKCQMSCWKCIVENNMACCAKSCSFERSRHHCDLIVKGAAASETWDTIQGDSGGKVNVFRGDSTGHYKKNTNMIMCKFW